MDKEPIWVIQEKRLNGKWIAVEFCYSREAARQLCREWWPRGDFRVRKYVPEEK